ncbi:hypothetical protein PTSG_06572 [Salpingoeca rosetta]|uniref:EGF-like domain-containing protein n=1 Tax=Salpingoeca rosetta (strain ATCC 50818 / BSB-021) TaxID=946362 RepID=F2UG69_SALR5|nr:uncharacterized protein PTSG_06572 [Salpingoeca rosetta]EGD75497.1 hypothetical protein PTSG_06572 [Salpingoeca rosetta]|eukprot:XP_004991954.1 hypothetical protein PTSG_06572 [Salpingoeca rosetta]
MFLRQLQEELTGAVLCEPTLVHTDNQPAQRVAEHAASRMRHILVKYHYIRECVDTKRIVLSYLATEHMIADLLTKILPRPKTAQFCTMLFDQRPLPGCQPRARPHSGRSPRPSTPPGRVSVLVKGGKVKDSDGWPRGESDTVVEVRVPDYTGWMHTTEDEDDNSPAWHETLEFPNTDIPSTFSVELHAFDLDGFAGVNHWGDTDDLGRDTDSFTFDGCNSVSRDHRFDLDGDNKYIDVTINYTPTDLCLSNNGDCGPARSTSCTCVRDEQVQCQCMDGFKSDTGKDCFPIDPCQTSTFGGCDKQHGVCTYLGPGESKCACKGGYRFASTSDHSNCDPINPCEDVPGRCGENSLCVYDGPDKFHCTCVEGYESANAEKTDCRPINPCEKEGYGGCDANTQLCRFMGPNTNECDCKPGFDGADGGSCDVVNPCEDTPTLCGDNSTCIHTGPGIRNCTCHEGHTSTTGRNCFPINPCVTDNGGCGFENSTRCLFDGPDLASCVCRSGFAGDPPNTPCEPVDPCSIDNVCGANAECTRTGLHTYNCSCIAGHVSDNGGRNCTHPSSSSSSSSSFVASSTGSMPPVTTALDPAASQSTANSISAATWGGIAGGVCGLVVLTTAAVVLVKRRRCGRTKHADIGINNIEAPGQHEPQVYDNPVFRPSSGTLTYDNVRPTHAHVVRGTHHWREDTYDIGSANGERIRDSP